MNKKNKKKIRILRTVIIVFIILGIALIMYPVYTNFIAGNRESTVLSAWKEQKGEFFKEIGAFLMGR